eukprot:10980-Chlamydomonas_euryale.AAC.1
MRRLQLSAAPVHDVARAHPVCHTGGQLRLAHFATFEKRQRQLRRAACGARHRHVIRVSGGVSAAAAAVAIDNSRRNVAGAAAADAPPLGRRLLLGRLGARRN